MPKLLETLRERLLVAGIAPRHVRRYIAELGDHLADLHGQCLDEVTALARLGSVEDLAKPMLDRREFRSFVSRYPRTMFGIVPLLAWLALSFGVLLLVAVTGIFRIWTPAVFYGFAYIVFRALPIAFAVTALVCATRQRSALKPAIIGAALVLVMACTSDFSAYPSTVPGSTEYQFTCWLIPFLVPFTDAVGPMNGSKVVPGLLQAAGILAAIVTGSLLWRRHQQQTEQHHD